MISFSFAIVFVNRSLNESKNIFMKKFICCRKENGKNLFVHLFIFFLHFFLLCVLCALCSVAVELYFIIFHLFLTYVRYLFICFRHLFSYDIKHTNIHTTKIQWVKVCTKNTKSLYKSMFFLLLFHINFYLFCVWI